MNIQVENLEFNYSNSGFVLRIDKLDLESGRKVAVIGPSGSGKTTLLGLIAGILPVAAGVIQCDGVDIGLLNDAERRRYRIQSIGQVFQSFELVQYLNVRENILLPYRINPALLLNEQVVERMRMLAGEAGLSDKLPRRVDTLSHGERQRVALCRALVAKPRCILADEPTGNLDPDVKKRVMDLLVRLTDESGATLLMVTHDHGLLEYTDMVLDIADPEYGVRLRL